MNSSLTEKPKWKQFRDNFTAANSVLDHFDIEHPAVPIHHIVKSLDLELVYDFDKSYPVVSLHENKIHLGTIQQHDKQRYKLAMLLGELLGHEPKSFAKLLLMPEWMVVPYFRASGYNAKRMADIFGVPYIEMGKRLGEIFVP